MKKLVFLNLRFMALCCLVSLLGGCTPKRSLSEEEIVKINLSHKMLEEKLYNDRPAAKKILDQMSDEEFLPFAGRGGMDRSLFVDHIDQEEFRQRIFALSDDNFTKLMTKLKIWHGGTPLQVLIHTAENTDFEGGPQILSEFWKRIKKLKKDQILQVLRADYLEKEEESNWIHDKNTWIKNMKTKLNDNIPNILQEMDTFLGEKTTKKQPERELIPRRHGPLEEKLWHDRPAAKKMLDQMSDEDFLDFAMGGGMDGSTFGDHLEKEEFRQRVFALSDDNFTKLMTELKIWHGGTPLMLLVYTAQSAAFGGKEPYLLREFWDRIKKLKKDQILQILNANYLGHKFPAWIKEEFNRRDVPSDILQEMDTFLGKETA